MYSTRSTSHPAGPRPRTRRLAAAALLAAACLPLPTTPAAPAATAVDAVRPPALGAGPATAAADVSPWAADAPPRTGANAEPPAGPGDGSDGARDRATAAPSAADALFPASGAVRPPALGGRAAHRETASASADDPLLRAMGVVPPPDPGGGSVTSGAAPPSALDGLFPVAGAPRPPALGAGPATAAAAPVPASADGAGRSPGVADATAASAADALLRAIGARAAAGRDDAGGRVLDERGLRAALLDHMDFPAGWASDSRRTAAERGIGVPRPDEEACRQLFESGEETTARAGFARTETGPFVTTVAAAHAGPADARRAVAAFRQRAATDCATFHTREGPEGNSLTVAYEAGEPAEMRPELERLGADAEDSAALRYHRRLDGGTGGTPVIAEVVIVRVGSHTVRVAQAGRDDAGTGSVAAIAARAVEKLQQVCDGHTPTPEPHQPGTTEL
ncbi:hypothetical protein [Streptomyces sp. 6N223]|uniref:hypothetical protein n=1 Tax=Streptomyces sp. 6N223 TaxID=3457412 RepID=UPI003FD1668C